MHERGEKCAVYNLLVENHQGNYCMEGRWAGRDNIKKDFREITV
jgi:hypothetical protein